MGPQWAPAGSMSRLSQAWARFTRKVLSGELRYEGECVQHTLLTAPSSFGFAPRLRSGQAQGSRLSRLCPQERLCARCNVLRREAVFLHEQGSGSRSPEPFNTQNAACLPHEFAPAYGRCCFNGQPRYCGRGQYFLPIGLWLLSEQFPRRHADHARPDSFGFQQLFPFQSHSDL